jgi:hypothetical protein
VVLFQDFATDSHERDYPANATSSTTEGDEMSERIFLVQGTTGEYSDRSEWVVCAFRSKEKAEAHAHDAQWRAKEIEHSHQRYYHPKQGENEFDPEMQMDYTGTAYFLEECELRD